MISLPIVVGTLAVLAAQRGAEILYARRTAQALAAKGARFVRDDGFGLILVVHGLWFAGLGLESLLSPYAALGWWTWAGASLWLAGATLRYSSMAALGLRWNTRVWVLPSAPLVARGPYRWLRHPIYVGVALELVGVPLAFGAWATVLGLLPLHGVALARRIKAEERALGLATS